MHSANNKLCSLNPEDSYCHEGKIYPENHMNDYDRLDYDRHDSDKQDSLIFSSRKQTNRQKRKVRENSLCLPSKVQHEYAYTKKRNSFSILPIIKFNTSNNNDIIKTKDTINVEKKSDNDDDNAVSEGEATCRETCVNSASSQSLKDQPKRGIIPVSQIYLTEPLLSRDSLRMMKLSQFDYSLQTIKQYNDSSSTDFTAKTAYDTHRTAFISRYEPSISQIPKTQSPICNRESYNRMVDPLFHVCLTSGLSGNVISWQQTPNKQNDYKNNATNCMETSDLCRDQYTQTEEGKVNKSHVSTQCSRCGTSLIEQHEKANIFTRQIVLSINCCCNKSGSIECSNEASMLVTAHSKLGKSLQVASDKNGSEQEERGQWRRSIGAGYYPKLHVKDTIYENCLGRQSNMYLKEDCKTYTDTHTETNSDFQVEEIFPEDHRQSCIALCHQCKVYPRNISNTCLTKSRKPAFSFDEHHQGNNLNFSNQSEFPSSSSASSKSDRSHFSDLSFASSKESTMEKIRMLKEKKTFSHLPSSSSKESTVTKKRKTNKLKNNILKLKNEQDMLLELQNKQRPAIMQLKKVTGELNPRKNSNPIPLDEKQMKQAEIKELVEFYFLECTKNRVNEIPGLPKSLKSQLNSTILKHSQNVLIRIILMSSLYLLLMMLKWISESNIINSYYPSLIMAHHLTGIMHFLCFITFSRNMRSWLFSKCMQKQSVVRSNPMQKHLVPSSRSSFQEIENKNPSK